MTKLRFEAGAGDFCGGQSRGCKQDYRNVKQAWKAMADCCCSVLTVVTLFRRSGNGFRKSMAQDDAASLVRDRAQTPADPRAVLAVKHGTGSFARQA